MGECIHEWACPGAVPLQMPGQGGVNVLILLPLYCTKCAKARTLIAPPGEEDPAAQLERARNLPPVPLRRNGG